MYTGGAFVRADVLVEDGVVAGVGDLSVSQAETVDVSGKHLLHRYGKQCGGPGRLYDGLHDAQPQSGARYGGASGGAA